MTSLPHTWACQHSPCVCSCRGPHPTCPNPLARYRTRRMSGFNAPAAWILQFCLVVSASKTQRHCLRLDGTCQPGSQREGLSRLSDTAPPWFQGWQNSLPMGTVLPALPAHGCLAAPGLLRDTEEGQAPLFAGGTFQSRGSRWLPRFFVPVLLAQRSKKIEEKTRKKHPASSSPKLQTSLIYKCP